MQQSDWSSEALEEAENREVTAAPLPSSASLFGRQARLSDYLGSVERDVIVRALRDANHNQTRAAKRLGISRRGLIYKMEKYGLKSPPSSRKPQPVL